MVPDATPSNQETRYGVVVNARKLSATKFIVN
jgi:hypothetical protein